MKKITLLITALFISFITTSFSQSEKNDLKLTISALPLYGAFTGYGSGFNGYVLKPSVGYNISERTSIELNFSYATLNQLKVGTIDSYYNSYAFIPTLRNNIINKTKVRFFTEIGFGFGTIKYSPDNEEFRNSEFNDLSGGISVLNVGIGGNYYFNDNIGLEVIIPYIRSTNITSENANNLYSGIGPTLGLTFNLN